MQDKFGLTFKDAIKIIDKYKNSNSIRFKCLSVHIGSQITSIGPYKKTLDFLLKTIKSSGISFEFVDLGGGFGIPYNKNDKIIDIKNYAKLVQTFKNKLNCKIILYF